MVHKLVQKWFQRELEWFQKVLVQIESCQSQLCSEVLCGLGRLGQGYLNFQSWMLGCSREGN